MSSAFCNACIHKSLCLAQENREMRHPCTSTDERELTDWREQVTTRRDLRRLLFGRVDTVCINSNKLQWTATIEIKVTFQCSLFRFIFRSTCTMRAETNFAYWKLWKINIFALVAGEREGRGSKRATSLGLAPGGASALHKCMDYCRTFNFIRNQQK